MEFGGANQFNSGRGVVTALWVAALHFSFGLNSDSPLPSTGGGGG
jgi:hypothetical protein